MEGTGIPALDALLVWGGAITVLAAVLALVWRAVRGVLHLLQRVEDFMDDWTGDDERPGVPGRPGVMERLSGFEDRMSRVEHELHPNSGDSLRDAVDETNRRLIDLCSCAEGEHPPPE